jgi:nitronate monooxygenase
LINDQVRHWRGRELEMLQKIDTVVADYNAAREAGNYDIAAVIAGEAVGLIHEIAPASDIIERIISEAEQIFSQRHNSISFDSR